MQERSRATQPERYEIYTATLQKRLPRFRLPLAADDRDTVLDLHAAFTRCYDQGGFATEIDYTRDPSVPLNEEDRKWLDEVVLLRQPHVNADRYQGKTIEELRAELAAKTGENVVIRRFARFAIGE